MSQPELAILSSVKNADSGFFLIPDAMSFIDFPSSPLIDEDDEEVLRIVRSCSFDNQFENESLESEPPQNNSWSSFTHFGPRCNRCGNPCGEDAIYHGSMAFHKDHFTCYKCGSMIKIPVFVNGEMYCKRCGKDIQPKSYTCFVCGAPRNMESVIIDEKCYCKKHFQCSICGCILNKNEYVVKDNNFYCSEHAYFAQVLPKCFKCGGDITGKRILSTINKQYHPDCFSCELCHKSLVDHKYMIIDDKLICIKCYKSLPKDIQKTINNSLAQKYVN